MAEPRPNGAGQPLVAGVSEDREVSRGNEREAESLWTQFTQQRLKAWQTQLQPTWVIALYVVGGVVFIGLGVVLLLMSWDVEEHVLPYTDVVLDENGVGSVDVTVPKDMLPPIWVYYQLDGFHQNHRRYVKSRDDRQLEAVQPAKVTEQELQACQPLVTGESGRPLYPCGLVARSVFNDSFALVFKGPEEGEQWKKLEVDSSARTIAWAADVDSGKFANYNPTQASDGTDKTYQELVDMWILRRFPPVACVQTELSDEKRYKPAYVTQKDGRTACRGYNTKEASCDFTDIKGNPIQCDEIVPVPDWGVRSGHLMVWMRVAGLPNFRKLWGKVDQRLAAGTKLKIYVASNFPVKGFHGTKSVVVSTSSPLGGRNDFLGWGYMVVGICCLIFGTWFLSKHLSNR